MIGARCFPGVGVAVERDTELASVATAQAYTGEDAARAPGQGDVFEQHSGHALAFPIRGCGIVPQAREVGREGQDPPAGVVTDGEAVLGAAPVALVFGFAHRPQTILPFRLEDIGDKTVAGVGFHVAPSCELGRLARSLHGLLAECGHLVVAGLQLLVHAQRGLQRHRLDELDE